MTGLVDVFSAWFRTFGYTTVADATVQGRSGSHHQLPLLVELDARRIGVYTWLKPDAPTVGFFESVKAATKDLELDDCLILSLAGVNDADRAPLRRHGVHVWDPRRIVQELGEAVLAETCPDAWPREDPLQAARFSRIEHHIVEERTPLPRPEPTPATLMAQEPTAELPFPVAVPPALATPAQQPAPELVVPPAFGIFDTPATDPSPATTSPPSAIAAATPPARPEKAILRSQVSKALALSLVRKKIKVVDRMILRLTPFYVFDYEAHLLVDGSLDAQSRKGRMAVDASMKKIHEWALPLEIGDVVNEGIDVDEKKIRVDEPAAANLLRQELAKLVTRNVVLEEDADEWSVVVKKKVELAPNDINIAGLGTFWLPVWRIAGKEGSIEIDATSGAIVHEDIVVEKADAQLI